MAKVHEIFLQKYFDGHPDAVLTGSELAGILSGSFPELSEINCRKIISCTVKKGVIKSSAPITFGNHQYAYFSSDRPVDYNTLKDVIREHKKYLHRAIFAIKRNGGWLSELELVKITGVTSAQNTHNVNIQTVKQELAFLKIAESVIYKKSEFIVSTMANADVENQVKWLKTMNDYNLLVYQVCEWMGRANLIDMQQASFIGAANNFRGTERNGELWDMFGFTNTVGLGTVQKEFQTIVVVDVGFRDTYEEYDFIGFQERVNRLIHSVHGEKRKVLPIVFAKDFSPRARQLLKKNYYMNFSLSMILGQSFVEVARKYNQTIEKLQRKVTGRQTDILTEVKEMLNTFRESGSEENYGNLKGHLFEYLMYPVFQKIYPERDVRMIHGYTGSVKGEKFECDYLIDTPSENIIVELKGYRRKDVIRLGSFLPETEKPEQDTVKWFLVRTFELCRKSYGGNKKFKFSYITTAQIEDAAVKKMEERKKEKPERIQCCYDYSGLIELLNNYGMAAERKIIEQFYDK